MESIMVLLSEWHCSGPFMKPKKRNLKICFLHYSQTIIISGQTQLLPQRRESKSSAVSSLNNSLTIKEAWIVLRVTFSMSNFKIKTMVEDYIFKKKSPWCQCLYKQMVQSASLWTGGLWVVNISGLAMTLSFITMVQVIPSHQKSIILLCSYRRVTMSCWLCATTEPANQTVLYFSKLFHHTKLPSCAMEIYSSWEGNQTLLNGVLDSTEQKGTSRTCAYWWTSLYSEA